MAQKASPYSEFKNWLFDNNDNTQLEEWVIKAINKRAVLSSFGCLNKLTIYLNQNFNNYDFMKIDDEEFYIFMKQFVRRFGVNKYDLVFFKSDKKKKDTIQINDKLKMLKEYELSLFMDMIVDDPEYDQFMDAIGATKYKKSKLTKKEKKELHRPEVESVEHGDESGVRTNPKEVGVCVYEYAKKFGVNLKFENGIIFGGSNG